VSARKTQQLAISNETEVERFYFARFEELQKSCCKVVGKAFVKLVEPKKPTYYPYTNGDTQALHGGLIQKARVLSGIRSQTIF
jgi:hypothetical protein